MRFYSKIIAALTLLATLIIYVGNDNKAVASGVCGSEEDNSAFVVAVKIQDAVRGRSLENMIKLFRKTGTSFSHRVPRERDLEGKKFDDIFPIEWQQKVLSSEPNCDPVGWRGYMLSNGLVWYDGEGISALNGIEFFNPPPEGGVWTFEDYGLSPACFAREWMSSDNYQEIERKYIDDQSSSSIFLSKPGLFLLDSLPVDPIPAFDLENINIVNPVENCSLPIARIKLDSDWAQGGGKGEDSELTGSHEYRILESLPPSLCPILAPHVEERCLGIKLIETLDEMSGTIGQVSQFHIFGLIGDNNSRVFVAPLENFETYNEALDRVDTLLGR